MDLINFKYGNLVTKTPSTLILKTLIESNEIETNEMLHNEKEYFDSMLSFTNSFFKTRRIECT